MLLKIELEEALGSILALPFKMFLFFNNLDNVKRKSPKFDLRMLKERVNWKPRNKAETNLSDLNLNTQSRNLAKRALELQFKGQY